MSNSYVKIIRNNPENFVYLFYTQKQLAYFPNGSIVKQKIVNQAQRASYMFTAMGVSADDAVKVLADGIRAKYGMTPQRFLQCLAQGNPPVVLSSWHGIGDTDDADDTPTVEIDPVTGFPVSIMDEAEAADSVAVNGIGNLNSSLFVPQTLDTPLPVYNANSIGLKDRIMNDMYKSYVVVGNNGATYSNIIDNSTGKTKAVIDMSTGKTVSVRDKSTGNFRASVAKFKECWGEIASCTEDFKSILSSMSSMMGDMLQWIAQLINLCKGNGAVANCEWSPAQPDCWDGVRTTTSQTNWGVLALLGIGLWYISKD